MRFNVLLSITFLATLASGLVIPGSDDLESREFDLEIRDGLVEDASNSMLFRRKSSNAKKARIAAAKPAKAQAKADRKSSFSAAAKAHKATTNLPGRKDTFKVRGGGPGKPAQKFTGKEVRKAVFDSHMEANKMKGMSKTQQKKSKLKQFSNHPHQTPKGLGGKNVRPIHGMKVDNVNKPAKKGQGKGREFPLPNKNKNAAPGSPGPARVITQQTKAGHQTFKGVIAHDQKRPAGSPGYNDHFQVKANKAPKKKST